MTSERTVHDTERFGRSGSAQGARRDTRDCGSRVYRFENHGTRANARVSADLNISKDDGSCANQDTVPHLRVPIPGVLPRSAESDILEDRNIVFDHRGFTDDNARRVVEKDAATNRYGWMNIDLEDAGRSGLKMRGNITSPRLPQCM
jgi:hypothetical protein